MRQRIIEFCLVMSCFLLTSLVNFVQSIEQRDIIASAIAFRLKEKLNLQDSQAAAIKVANVKFYEALSSIYRTDYVDENSYQQAIQKVRSNHREKILQMLTRQQQQQWQIVLKEECLEGP